MNKKTLLFLRCFIFFAGIIGSIVEVLWLKKLNFLLGNCIYASTAVLTAYFAGMAFGQLASTGNFFRKSVGYKGIGVALVIFSVFLSLLYVPDHLIFQVSKICFPSSHLFLSIISKTILSFVLMFPSAFITGILFPATVFLIDSGNGKREVPFFYGLFTIGGASGAFFSGFVLLPVLGFKTSLIITSVITLIASGLILLRFKNVSLKNKEQTAALIPKKYLIIAFVSGLCTLSLEMLWIRMFTYVDQNSTYTFSLILSIILCAFGFSGIIAEAILKKVDAGKLLFYSLCTTSFLILLIPSIFVNMTDGLWPLGSNLGWNAYLRELFFIGLSVIFFPALSAGLIFPILMHDSKMREKKYPDRMGILLSVNTIGAIAGCISALFFLPATMGLWKSIWIISMVYLISALIIPYRKIVTVLPLLLMIIFSVVFLGGDLPLQRPELSKGSGEYKLLDFKEDCGGSIAVVSSPDNLCILLNNKYFLGGTRSGPLEEMQAVLPLLLHKNPENVYFIGMGTGITAGASLLFPVKRVVVSEIIPGLIGTAKEWFSSYTNGLFYDKRVKIIPEDGRWLLVNSSDTYDVIISDLVVPWESGAGNLYSLEHFVNVRDKLKENGIFALWLPLYQMSKKDFDIVSKTMLSVFPLVTMWRGDFIPQSPSVCLLAFKSLQNFDLNTSVSHLNDTLRNILNLVSKEPVDSAGILRFYCGNLNANKKLFQSVPINTDNNMLIEYMTPIEQCDITRNKKSWFTGNDLINYVEQIQNVCPPQKDPFLSGISKENVLSIGQGLQIFKRNMDY